MLISLLLFLFPQTTCALQLQYLIRTLMAKSHSIHVKVHPTAYELGSYFGSWRWLIFYNDLERTIIYQQTMDIGYMDTSVYLQSFR
jgi:hypothetical protein